MSNYIYAVTIGLDVPIYLTDFHRNIGHNGHTFIAGKLKVDQPVIQKSEPSANDFTLMLSAVDQTLVSAIGGNPYKGKPCLVERLTLNDDETVASYEVWLDGELNQYSYTNKLKESVIKLKVSSIFGAFESVKMLNLNAQFADTINEDQTLYWGKKSPQTTTYSGGGGGRNVDNQNLV